jgi:hypothetical protein
MALQLNPEQESVVGQAIQAGLIRAADEAVEVGVATIRRRLKAHPAPNASSSTSEWSRRFAAWTGSHPAAAPLLSDEAISRDSIYGGRSL